MCFHPSWLHSIDFVEGLPYLPHMRMVLQWHRMPLVLLHRPYLEILWHNSLSAELELELEMLAVLGLISWLLQLSAWQSDPRCTGAGGGWCFLHLLSNAGQSDPLRGGAGCRWCRLNLLPSAGQSDPPGGGTSCVGFMLPCQELHACERWISLLSEVDYLGQAHLRYLFPHHIPHPLVIQTCRSRCFHTVMTCVNSILSWRPLLIGYSPCGIRDAISSTTFLSGVYSLPSYRALISGQICVGIVHQRWVCQHNIRIGVGCGE